MDEKQDSREVNEAIISASLLEGYFKSVFVFKSVFGMAELILGIPILA